MTPENAPAGDAVDRLLSETRLDDDLQLAQALRELQSTADAEPPYPSAHVARLMSPRPLARVSRFTRRRSTIATALILGAVLAGGVSAAAASPMVRNAAQDAVAALTAAVRPAAAPKPTPTASPLPHDESARPASVPAIPAPASATPAPAPSAIPESTVPASVGGDREPAASHEASTSHAKATQPPRQSKRPADPSHTPSPKSSSHGN